MTRLHRGAKQEIRNKTEAWARAYRNPAIPSDVVTAEATIWARSVLDEVHRVAVQRGFLASLRHSGSAPAGSSKLRAALTHELVADAVAAVHRRRAFVTPAPLPRPDGVDAAGARRMAIQWMHYLGATEIEPTRDGRADGPHAVSDRFAVRIESWDGEPVTLEQVRAAHHAAARMGRTAIVFTKRGYSHEALDFARDADLPLFLLDARRGRLVGANPPATVLRNEGVHQRRRAVANA